MRDIAQWAIAIAGYVCVVMTYKAVDDLTGWQAWTLGLLPAMLFVLSLELYRWAATAARESEPKESR